MKMKLMVVAAVLSITGCSSDFYDRMTAPTHGAGQVRVANGIGFSYGGRTQQVSQRSIAEGDKYIAERKANDDLFSDMIAKENEKQKKADDDMRDKNIVSNKCELVTGMRQQILFSNMAGSPSYKNIKAYQDFVSSGKIHFYNVCMKLHSEKK